MRRIAIKFTYHTDIIEVPNWVAYKIKTLQGNFDVWLYDETNDHGLWVMIEGKKCGVSFGTSDFVNYLNSYVLPEDTEKASILQTDLDKSPKNLPTLYF